jgi:hypothetical protein
MTTNPNDLQKYLRGLDYPVSKEDLVRRAQELGADDGVLTILQALPQIDFNSANDVSHTAGSPAASS